MKNRILLCLLVLAAASAGYWLGQRPASLADATVSAQTSPAKRSGKTKPQPVLNPAVTKTSKNVATKPGKHAIEGIKAKLLELKTAVPGVSKHCQCLGATEPADRDGLGQHAGERK